jgi:hypothetical protein
MGKVINKGSYTGGKLQAAQYLDNQLRQDRSARLGSAEGSAGGRAAVAGKAAMTATDDPNQPWQPLLLVLEIGQLMTIRRLVSAEHDILSARYRKHPRAATREAMHRLETLLERIQLDKEDYHPLHGGNEA